MITFLRKRDTTNLVLRVISAVGISVASIFCILKFLLIQVY